MSTPQDKPHGRTSWTLTAIVLVPTLLLSGVVVVGIATGLVPVSLAISAQAASLSGQQIQVAADRLDGTQFTQYVVVDRTTKGRYPEGASGIKSAELHNLCQSVVSHVPGFGDVTLLIKAGGGGKPVRASRLVVDTDDLSGDALFTNVTMGQDASTLSGVKNGPQGVVGQQAGKITIDHLRQQTRSISADSFRLSGLHLTVKKGTKPCF
ncbi:MAG: hypothetical protein QOF84_4163 [Streptomyces sp.]|nr:hypothetical protein [Streptomyces sp.]MDX6349373.1 hypothetical protein [Streptomyces sp.]